MTRLGSARFDINYEGGQFHAQGPGSGFADAKSGNGTRSQIGTCERCPRKLSSAGISHDLCHVEMQLQTIHWVGEAHLLMNGASLIFP